MDYLIERIWAELGLVKVYTKKRGAHPDLTDPICLRQGATIEVRRRCDLQLRTGVSDASLHRAFATVFIGRWQQISDMH